MLRSSQRPLFPTHVAPQTILQPRQEPIHVRAARERGELDRREGRARVLRRLDEELAVAPVAPRRGSVLDERPHDLQVAGEDRDVERFESNPLDVPGQNRQQVFRRSAIHASVTSQNWWFDARVSSERSRAVHWAQGLRAHLWRTFGSRRALSFFDFGFGPMPKNTHGGGAESAGGGKTGVG